MTGRSFYYQENKSYYGASFIKILDALYLYENDLVDDKKKDCLQRAISKSENEAHHQIIRTVGVHD